MRIPVETELPIRLKKPNLGCEFDASSHAAFGEDRPRIRDERLAGRTSFISEKSRKFHDVAHKTFLASRPGIVHLG
jgi:hypothetical protein